MDFNEISKIVLNHIRSLDGTVEYKTVQYIGFKVCSKLFAEVHVNSNNIKILVNKNYLSEEELSNSYIKVMGETYKWNLNAELTIDTESNLKEILAIINKVYKNTKAEYTDKIRDYINNALEKDRIYLEKYIKEEEYVFKNLLLKWDEFLNYSISNSALDELKSDIESLSEFNSDDYINLYKNDEIKHGLISLIYQLISYIDKNAYNKNVLNEYEDKRTLALTFVRQNQWVRSLINYKKYKDLTKVPQMVRNVITYILNPMESITGFKISKLKQFAALINPKYKKLERYSELCSAIISELDKLHIPFKNDMNKGIVYANIMFSSELTKYWDKENNYYKIQPFKYKELSREEVQRNLDKNIFVSLEKNIHMSENIKNIFLCCDGDNILYLGIFIGEENKNNFFYRSFKILASTKKQVVELPKDKPWGNKFSSKVSIKVKDEEKQQFEAEVLNRIFDKDIDELLEENNDVLIDNKIDFFPKALEEFAQGEEQSDDDQVYSKEIETPLNLILYGPPGTGKTYNTVNYAVSIVENKEIEEVICESKNNRINVFNRYKKYLSEKKIVFTTFHQNYSYEEFIQGIRANTNNVDSLSFIKEEGIFKDLVERAKNDMGNNYVIIIDEINRGNISRIFGELITLIEEDKRLGELNETTVTLPSKETFVVPPNLFVLGTMNTADKSIANIDIALRRRFDFIPMFTDYSIIPDFQDILRPINRAIYEKKRSADFMIGHAFFVGKSIDELQGIVNRKIIPLLNEYFYLNSNEVRDILSRGGIRVRENEDTFQLEFDGLEE